MVLNAADALLPGGDIPDAVDFTARHPWLPERRLRHYGTIMEVLLAGRDGVEVLGAGLHAADVAYLVEREWSRTAEDVLWRRTR